MGLIVEPDSMSVMLHGHGTVSLTPMSMTPASMTP